MLNRLNDEGFEVVAEFVTIPVGGNNPTACAKNDVDCGFNPAYLGHMQAVGEALARRYPFIRQWEFWNEPEQWPNAGRDICGFGTWLEQFYLGVKKADPTMPVAFNTLAGVLPDWDVWLRRERRPQERNQTLLLLGRGFAASLQPGR